MRFTGNKRFGLLTAAAMLLPACDDTSGGIAFRAPDAEIAPAPAMLARPREMAGAEIQLEAPQRYLIRRAEVTLEVKDVDSASAVVRNIAEDVGGRVEGFEHVARERAVRHDLLTLRVPEPRLDESLGRVRELGKVEHLSASEQEATQQVVDLDIRLRNLRRLEERLLRLLEGRTAKLEEVLAAERELARVRQEIERYEGQRRTIEREAAWSLLRVELHEPYPAIARGAGGVWARLGRAFVQAGENFVVTIAVGIAALGVIVPLGALAALLFWLYRRYRGAWGAGKPAS